ncbi:hypothetical protein AaE_002282, partial [Aphanomyces astaci]
MDNCQYNHERRVEQKRWSEAVQWLKLQREALQLGDKGPDRDAKRQRLFDMDRQVRAQNQKRFAKSPPQRAPTNSPKQKTHTPVQWELPPRKPPVPRLHAATKGKRRQTHDYSSGHPPQPNHDGDGNNDAGDAVLRPPRRPATRRKRKVAPEPPPPAVEADKMSEDTQKRRQLARVYMEQQKAKRKERARQRRRQDEEEAVLRREQLEKLDAVRWQRVQESVALAKKSGGHVRSNPDNNREAPSSSSMTELLLGFRTLPPRSKKLQPTYEEDIIPLDNDDQITDSAQEEPNLDEDLWSSGDDQNTDEVVESDDGDDGDDRRCAVEVLSRTDPPPPPTSSSPPLLLLKLQALKQLTDQLTSRVGRLSNNNEVDLDDHDGATAQSTRNEERGSVDELDESNDVASSGDDEDAGPPHQHRPDRTAALEASSAPSASWQTPDIHLDAPPEPAPWQRSMDSEDRTPWWEDESESTRHVSSRVVLPPVVHVQSDTRLHQRYANGDGDETRTMTTTMEVHVSRSASLVDGNASSSTEDDDDKQVARWMALRQRRQLGEIRDEAAQVQLHPGHNDKLHSVGYRESPLFGPTSLQSARNHPMGDRREDDDDDAELDRLIHATRDAYSVVDMYAQQLFQQQQQNRITFELSAATENKDVPSLADRFEEIASDTDNRFQDDGRQDMDDLADSIRWPKDIHTTDEVSSTTAHEDYAHDDDDGPACGGYTGRSIEELLAEA